MIPRLASTLILALSLPTVATATAAAPDSVGHIKTFNMEDWGGGPNAKDAAKKILMKNFSKAFPNGLRVGKKKRDRMWFIFDDPEDIRKALPIRGLPHAMSESTKKGVRAAGGLAGQLIAAKLNVAFDAQGITGGTKANGETPLSELTLKAKVPGKLTGLTVRELINLADQALSGKFGDAKPHKKSVDVDHDDKPDTSFRALREALNLVNNSHQKGDEIKNVLGDPTGGESDEADQGDDEGDDEGGIVTDDERRRRAKEDEDGDDDEGGVATKDERRRRAKEDKDGDEEEGSTETQKPKRTKKDVRPPKDSKDDDDDGDLTEEQEELLSRLEEEYESELATIEDAMRADYDRAVEANDRAKVEQLKTNYKRKRAGIDERYEAKRAKMLERFRRKAATAGDKAPTDDEKARRKDAKDDAKTRREDAKDEAKTRREDAKDDAKARKADAKDAKDAAKGKPPKKGGKGGKGGGI